MFTELQLMGLEKRFETQKYLSTPDRMDLAESLGKAGLLHFQKCYYIIDRSNAVCLLRFYT